MSCWNQNTLIHKFTSRRAYCSSNPSLFYERKFIAADLYFLPLCPFMRILNASDCVWIGVCPAHSPSLCMTRPLFSSFFPSAYGASILSASTCYMYTHTHKHTHTHRRTHNIHIQAVFSSSLSLSITHTDTHWKYTQAYVQSIQIVRGSHMRCNKGN